MQGVFKRLLGDQLTSIYMHHRFGGSDSQEICSRITNVPESHWILNPDECNELIAKQSSSAVNATCALLSILFIVYYSYATLRIFSALLLSVSENRIRRVYQLGEKYSTIPFDVREAECSSFAQRPGQCKK